MKSLSRARQSTLLLALFLLVLCNVLYNVHNLQFTHYDVQGKVDYFSTSKKLPVARTSQALGFYSVFNTPNHNDKDVSISNSYFQNWAKHLRSDCTGHVVGYSSVLLRFHNVIMDKNFARVNATGGTEIKGIMHQTEESEVYRLNKGFIKVPCERQVIKYEFDKHSSHLRSWINSTEYITKTHLGPLLSRNNATFSHDKQFTIATMRYEFTNVYWVIMDLYNIYLTMSFFKKSLSETKLLLIDERPQNSLDDLYKTVYNVQQLHEYPSVTVLDDLVWAFPRSKGPMLKKQNTIPLAFEFRRDVLHSFGLSSNHTIKCDALNIHFIWRRNYVAHPRNPSGLVWRKIKNEDEILNATKTAFPNSNVRGVQLDTLSTKEQLEYISSTDVLVGMHGAAFGFSLLLPSGSGAIEMFPQYVGANWHMEYLAKWAGVHHRVWKNKNKQLEDTKQRYTTIPPDILLTLLNSTVKKVCSK